MSAHGIQLEREGDQVRVHAQADIEVGRAIIWRTVSDYDHLAQIIPNMSSSREIYRDGSTVLVEQRGTLGIGPIRRSFAATFSVTEHFDESISMSALAGDFSRFDATYEIVPLATGRSRIVYDATIVPDHVAPQLITDAVLRLVIGEQFDALVHEIMRRAQVR